MESERHTRYRAEVQQILGDLDELLANREDDAVDHDLLEEWTAMRARVERVRALLAADDVPAAHSAARGAKSRGLALELKLHAATDRTSGRGASGIGRFLGDLADLFRIFG